MNSLRSAINLQNKTNKFNKYSNYTLFSRRETEYSSLIKQKNNSNQNTSIQRPYSSTFKISSMRNMSKISSGNNKFKNFNSVNQSLIFSTNLSKSKKNRIIHIEDYFHKKSKSKTNKLNIMKSILNLEKYYTPNTSFNNKKQNICTNLNINPKSYFNDLQYINDIYITEVNLKKPTNKNNSIVNYDNFNFVDYNDKIYKDLSKKPNSDILLKFNKDISNYNCSESVKTEYNDRIINNKRRRINLCREKKHEFMEKKRKQKVDKLSLNSKKNYVLEFRKYIKIKWNI